MSDTFQSDRSHLSSELRTLESNAREDAILDDVRNIGSQLQNLPNQLRDFTQRGYAYGKSMQQKLDEIAGRWKNLEEDARYKGQQHSRRLVGDVRDLEDALNRANPIDSAAAQSLVSRFNSEIQRVRREIDDTKQQIKNQLGDIPQQVSAIADQVSKISNYLKLAGEASFPFKSGESVFIAVGAEWKKTNNNKENPDGVLFVTNQRIIMEQKEKQGGFAGFGGKKVQQLAWEAPVTSIQGVTPENKGLFGNVDLVHLKFGSGGPAAEVLIEVKDVKAQWFTEQLQALMQGRAT